MGLSLNPNSIKICEKKNINGNFFTRLESDLEKRYLNKIMTEMNEKPSFQPLIYENMRS